MSEPTASKAWHGPPPPAELTGNTSSLRLLSQGAEARVWLVTLPDPSEGDGDGNDNNNSSNGGGGGRTRSINVGSGISVPQLLGFSQRPSPLSSPATQTTPHAEGAASRSSPPSSSPLKIVCKERFSKKYRHPQLDASLTKSRTKGEARSLIRCQRADVPCTKVLAIAHWSSNSESETAGDGGGGKDKIDGAGTASSASSCLFLEYVEGCTVRQYFERRSGEQRPSNNGDGVEHATKRPRREEGSSTADSATAEFRKQQDPAVTTAIDSQTLRVARTIGTLVARMHAAGVIHGDLTTSNIMIGNPPWTRDDVGDGADNADSSSSWEPRLVLIDFGLATSTTASSNRTNSSGNKQRAKPHKQQHNAEEKAVDLYVLERAFLSTHPESERLVEEVWKGYRGHFENLDREEVDAGGGEGGKREAVSDGGDGDGHARLAKAVMTRLEQVRMRGRKRECFG